MPSCKNGKGSYKGTEPSPRGRGFCAKHEKIGTKKRGKDKKMWVVRSVKMSTGKRSKRWFKVLGKPKPRKKTTKTSTKKKTTKRKKLRGGVNSEEARAGQMICDVLRLYIPVYAFEKNEYTTQSFIRKLQNKIDLYTLDKQSLDLFKKYPQRKSMYESKLEEFNRLLAQLDPRVSVALREVFVNKRNTLKEHLHTNSQDVMMVLDPEGFYKILKEIGCEKAAVIDVYTRKSDGDLDEISGRSASWATKVSAYRNRHGAMPHPYAHDNEYEVNSR